MKRTGGGISATVDWIRDPALFWGGVALLVIGSVAMTFWFALPRVQRWWRERQNRQPLLEQGDPE